MRTSVDEIFGSRLIWKMILFRWTFIASIGRPDDKPSGYCIRYEARFSKLIRQTGSCFKRTLQTLQLKFYPFCKRTGTKLKILLRLFIREILILIQAQDLLGFDGERKMNPLK